jgi:hypothetical protein
MAQRKASRGRKTKGKKKPARRRPARKARPKARRAAPAGASKRLTELEAENRRLREENASLRAQLDDRSAPPEREEIGEQTPLDF